MTAVGCLIIAEAGVNHNGDIGMALELVDIAAKAGVDAIKFQTFSASRIVTRVASCADYQKINTGVEQTQWEMLKRLELSFDEFSKIKEYCDKMGVEFLSTPFDEESADYLINQIGMSKIKVPSGESTNHPFLKYLAKFNRHMIISTGMSDLVGVDQSIAAVRSVSEGLPLSILHCTSEYPCPYPNVNLNAMRTISQKFGLPVGLSDHSSGIEVSIAAAALGATIIEKHFTISKSLPGPDHRCSLEYAELAQMVRSVRNVLEAMGDGQKLPTSQELKTRDLVGRSLVLRQNLAAGSQIKRDDLVAKRPGGGVSPNEMDKMVGKYLKVDKNADEVLLWQDVWE